jgi:excisionase family DNA binding protein
MLVENLETYKKAYVTVGELAEYWAVSRKQIHKQIEAGTLPAIRIGPRLLRVRTIDAIEFESRAKMRSRALRQASPVKRRKKLTPLQY